MSLDETVPADSALLSTHAEAIRDTREEVNDLVAVINGQVASVTTIDTITAQTIAAGTQMIAIKFIDTDGTVTYLSGGTDGQQVIIKLMATRSVTIAHSAAKTSGDINLNGDGTDLSAVAYDMLHLVNVGGDPTIGILGYWAELSRKLWA